MAQLKTLKGITWNHSRGYCPMVAVGQRYSELHPTINIEWSKRSLQEFANEHIGNLASKYDLLVIDHPWAGYAADAGIILSLDDLLPTSFLEDQAANSMGKSYLSYQFLGKQFALPIDAAAPVASSRPDLLAQMEVALPGSFDELLVLAEKGLVTMPGIPIDTLMNFYMMCGAVGEDPFQNHEVVIAENTGVQALQMFKELTDRLNPEFFNWNPIDVYEAMTIRNDLAYCPWAYGYVNYSRRGYASTILHFHDLIEVTEGNPFRSTLGGTGLAVSAGCDSVDSVARFMMQVASPEIQKTLYFDTGGQPGHRSAWLDDYVNHQCHNFFKSTLRSLDNSFVRPRYNGYMHFQDHAGDIIRTYLMNGGNEKEVLSSLNKLYSESQKKVGV